MRVNIDSYTSKVGFILLDNSEKLLSINSEALKLLAYPHNGTPTMQEFHVQRIRSLVFENNTEWPAQFNIGRRRYTINALGVGILSIASNETFNALSLNQNHTNGQVPRPTQLKAVAILLERYQESTLSTAKITREFGLSNREQETVFHLTKGLTSKEIARRMNISPHTVKTHLRFIMMKMSVSSRSEVIGKLIQSNTTDNASASYNRP